MTLDDILLLVSSLLAVLAHVVIACHACASVVGWVSEFGVLRAPLLAFLVGAPHDIIALTELCCALSMRVPLVSDVEVSSRCACACSSRGVCGVASDLRAAGCFFAAAPASPQPLPLAPCSEEADD